MADIAPGDVVGVLLAGGRSTRMGGGDKCLAEIGGRSILSLAITRFRPQVPLLILNANGDPSRFASFGLPVVSDTVSGFKGPLAGILAGMAWCHRHAPTMRFVATAAADTPFFPIDLVERLHAAIVRDKAIAIACSGGRPHPVFGLFPVSLVDDLEHFIATSPSLSVSEWVSRNGSIPVEFSASSDDSFGPFFNINTPHELARVRAASNPAKLHNG